MNDLNRNTRTLILSFVVAIFTLIPLRFYEAGNRLASTAEVLGIQRQVKMVLPNSELRKESVPVLEFPYEELELTKTGVSGCLPRLEADRVIGNLTEILKSSGLDSELVTAIMEEIERVEESICR